VQESFTDQTIELGVRIVERRQWLVRPWGTASAVVIIDRLLAACADGLAMGSQRALAKLVCPVVHQGQSMAANAISTLCIACTGQHHGEAEAGAARALQLTKMPGFIGHVSNEQQAWDLIPMSLVHLCRCTRRTRGATAQQLSWHPWRSQCRKLQSRRLHMLACLSSFLNFLNTKELDSSSSYKRNLAQHHASACHICTPCTHCSGMPVVPECSVCSCTGDRRLYL
jgi:hypothetical protein